jgi:hypothetical protein
MPPGVYSPVEMGVVAQMDQLALAAGDPLTGPGGAATVLIGHVGDARLWHCPAESRTKCARQFVIDRVAWIAGESLELAPSGDGSAAQMTVQDAVAAAGIESEVLSATVMPARDLTTADPRLHGVGNDPVWVLRAVRAGQGIGEDPSRAIDIVVVEDGTGEVVAAISQELAEDYEPATLLVQATTPSSQQAVTPFYRVERLDGSGVQEMRLDSAWGSPNESVIRRGPGLPAVIDPGEYVVRVWRASVAPDDSVGPARDECFTQTSVSALEELRLEAAFPDSGHCTFVTPTFINAGDGF